MMAWDAYADVQTIMQSIGNIQDTNASDYNTIGLAGMIMLVSVVAHDAYSDVSSLTGQFSNLSMSYYNTSTVNLSFTVYNLSGVVSNVSTLLATTNTS